MIGSPTKRLLLSLATAGGAFLPKLALGCAVCYGAPDSPMTQGMNTAIFTLLGVTGVVLGSFVTFMVYLARRARLFHDQSLDSELAQGNKRTE